MSIYSDASLIVTPNAGKAGKLYSIVPTDGTGDLGVVRATSATRVNSSGLIESVGANIARLDYTNGCPSILIEPQRTNLLLQSEMFTIGWTPESTTVSVNTTISPDGNLTADTLTEDAGNDIHRIYRNPQAIISGESYSSSIFVKKDTARYFRLCFIQSNSTSVWVSAQFDLDTKTFTSGVGSGGGTFVSASIIELSSGWFRVSLVASVPSTTANILYCLSDGTAIISSQSRGCPTYLGNVTNKIFIWGAELELGSNTTSYIPTTTATVTRNADVISKSGISDLIGQTEGTIFVDFNLSNLIGECNILEIGQNNNNRIRIRKNGTSIEVLVLNNGSTEANIITTNQSLGNHKLGFSYSQNNFQVYLDGNERPVDTLGNVTPNMSMLALGTRIGALGSDVFNDRINSMLLFKTRLTNDELATLTTL